MSTLCQSVEQGSAVPMQWLSEPLFPPVLSSDWLSPSCGEQKPEVWATFVRGKIGEDLFLRSFIKETKYCLLIIQLNFVVCLFGSLHRKEVCAFNECSDKCNEVMEGKWKVEWWRRWVKHPTGEGAFTREVLAPPAPGKCWGNPTLAKSFFADKSWSGQSRISFTHLTLWII